MTLIVAPAGAGTMQASDVVMEQAVRLMMASLALLDQAGAGATTYACHLSMAIDTLENDRLERLLRACGRPLPNFVTLMCASHPQ